MKKNLSLVYEFSGASVSDIKEINSSFASGSLKVMYLGANRNGSFFSRESVEKALPTLHNVPIVCHWDDEAGEIGGHDVEVVTNEDGSLRLKNLTEPCGVVPEHAQFRFVEEEDDEGVSHVYLEIDGVLLWKRQDVYRHIIDDLGGKVKHSMEITVTDGATDSSGYYNVHNFEFTALCLLENCEPCFQGSELELFSARNFKNHMEEMMCDLKEYMKQFDTPDGVEDKHLTEGGEEALEEKMELVAKYGIDIDTLDFCIDDYTVEELEKKFNKMKNPEGENGSNSGNFELTSNLFEEIRTALSAETVMREWGVSERYCYVDCDLAASEVYVWDTEDWLLYGLPYAMNGDKVSIDFACKKRKKYAIVDFDEGEQDSPFASMFKLLEEKAHNAVEFEEKYTAVSEQVASMESELAELRKFRDETKESELKSQRKAILDRFEDLNGIEAFENLKSNCDSYSLEDLEEKCYAIRGRHGTAAKFSAEPGQVKIVVPQNTRDDFASEPYGGIVEKYTKGSK